MLYYHVSIAVQTDNSMLNEKNGGGQSSLPTDSHEGGTRDAGHQTVELHGIDCWG